jgi:hypothetical protein
VSILYIFYFDFFSDKNTDQINFVSALEEIRLGIPYDSDKNNLAKTAQYLWNKCVKNPNLPGDVRQLITDLFERYANAVLSTRGIGQSSSLFPIFKSDAKKDAKLNDQMYFLLAQYAASITEYSQAETYILKMSDEEQAKDNVKIFMNKVINSIRFLRRYSSRFANAARRIARLTVLAASR